MSYKKIPAIPKKADLNKAEKKWYDETRENHWRQYKLTERIDLFLKSSEEMQKNLMGGFGLYIKNYVYLPLNIFSLNDLYSERAHARAKELMGSSIIPDWIKLSVLKKYEVYGFPQPKMLDIDMVFEDSSSWDIFAEVSPSLALAYAIRKNDTEFLKILYKAEEFRTKINYSAYKLISEKDEYKIQIVPDEIIVEFLRIDLRKTLRFIGMV